MSLPRIAIVIGTTREGRFADTPAAWIKALAEARKDATYELVDLRDFPLPLFDEPASPAWAEPKNDVAKAWGEKVASYDGFIFITAEYNHSISGALKNALDYAYTEFNRKPAAFVGYGGVGGARAVQQLRQIAVELQIAPLRNAVHIGLQEFMGIAKGEKTFADFPYLEDSAIKMLDDLAWWTGALKAARDGRIEAIAAE
ncbi:NAD(P)H-dependent oxidoreductase [Halovulum dunhuangense]|uniref:NAD(P)H-dependent oxidoreductase n=1 Tax=Halovulum dunhuangense TaxID=1505036 RepID=A0A849L241_9RHOB|nr:NAD(P)H-dependent oxidoreductase [Halovulum dunhuangense]NNU80291.1 NAD(P)H-dependent oxidoreductase [Halovulum dunhuangense]